MERFFRYALTVLISTVALMEFYQVIMRYIFEIPVMGLEEVLVYPTLWLYFFGKRQCFPRGHPNQGQCPGSVSENRSRQTDCAPNRGPHGHCRISMADLLGPGQLHENYAAAKTFAK